MGREYILLLFSVTNQTKHYCARLCGMIGGEIFDILSLDKVLYTLVKGGY